MTPLDLRQGDQVVTTQPEVGTSLWLVEKCVPGGFVMRKHSGGDARTWSMAEVFDVFKVGGLTHFPGPSRDADPKTSALRAQPLDSYEPWRRREAMRHLAYAKEADRRIKAGERLVEACTNAAETVYAAHIDGWRREEEIAAHRADAVAEQRSRRKPRPAEQPMVLPRDLEKHSPSAVRSWYLLWTRNGRDLRALIPRKNERGNRKPRLDHAELRQELFETAIKSFCFDPDKKPCVSSAYSEYEKLCAAKEIQPCHRSSFYRSLKSQYSEREEFANRYGRRAAYLRYGVFELRKPPEFALQEVQIDHCLIDVFVKPPGGGKPVRPWLTAVIDVASRMVLGIHVGFHPPSYACLQRAIAHAIWPKDLSEFPDIVNDWPGFGVFDLGLADNGLDLQCRSLLQAAAALGFEILNLPVRSPWLKGVIERLFRTLNTRVFDLAEGKVVKDKLRPHDAARDAVWSLDDLVYKVVKFLVDEYHAKVHPRIMARPLDRWRELAALRPVRLPPSPDLIIPLTGEVVRAHISSTGVHVEGLTYLDKEILTEIRAERGALDKLFEFRRDPYDIGVLHLQHDGRWLHIPCTTPQAAVGVSKFQHRMHLSAARHAAGAGNFVTVQQILDAPQVIADQLEDFKTGAQNKGLSARAARYGDDGGYATGLMGSGRRNPKPSSASTNDIRPQERDASGAECSLDEADSALQPTLSDWQKEWENGRARRRRR